MIKVKNKKIINILARKTLIANKTRNIIAISSIILTTLLFTSLFTIVVSINNGFQQSNFRQAGGFAHASFKYITDEQANELKTDPLIKSYGLRLFIGMPSDEPFNKSHVEVSYCDKNEAHYMYCDTIQGTLPKENTMQVATDTRVLKLLGVKSEIGTKFTLTFYVDGDKISKEFELSGFWEYDDAITASHVLIPKSRAKEILNDSSIKKPFDEKLTGSLSMDIIFSNSFNIEQKLNKVLENHGYQNIDSTKENYIQTGVNWGYSGSQLYNNFDIGTIIAIISALLLIIFTGYLIIYNIFHISVAKDIRFYGLLKTIGTTSKQLKKLILKQAIILSCFGIPIGLILGFIIGGIITPVITNQLNGVYNTISFSPIIFIISALFSLITVLISCYRPALIAGKASPIESVKFLDIDKKRKSKNVSILSMAISNISRNKGKTVVTFLSISLSVVILMITVMFTSGFDINKYLRNFCTDFQIADASYFQVGKLFSSETALDESVINQISAYDGVTGGKTYGKSSYALEFVSEDYYKQKLSKHYSEEEISEQIEYAERDNDNKIADSVQLYGMESFILDKLTVYEGDIDKLKQDNSKYIAAVYSSDDYDKIDKDSQWAKIGDKVKIRYVDEFEYINPYTNEVYDDNFDIENMPYKTRSTKYHDEIYTVGAIVTIPSSLCYRYYGDDEFILNDKTFINDTGTNSILYYAFDVDDKNQKQVASFIDKYTKEIDENLDYESKETYINEFNGFKNMFLILGVTLSVIIGVIGILNFLNTFLTEITTRKYEFALLQSIGMTGSQLKKLLIFEGLIYTLCSYLLSLIISIILSNILGHTLENIFWFFTYKNVFYPAFILSIIFSVIGILLPHLCYNSIQKQTIVERLKKD